MTVDVDCDVVVVGGGVIGLACAEYLQQQGRGVAVVDRGEIGGACSHGNCGLICPSHVLPLTEPGAVGAALRSIFRRNTPLKVRLRWDRGLWRWLWNFSRRCNHRDMLAGARALAPLLECSLQLYHQLLNQHSLQCEWRDAGQLFAFADQRAWAAYEATDRLLQSEFGIAGERLNAAELAQREPALRAGLAGGWYYGHDAHVRPDRLLSAWRHSLTERGVAFHPHCEVKKLGQQQASQLQSVVTDRGRFSGRAFVIASGVWTPEFAAQLGMRLPIQPGKGYSLTLPRLEPALTIPVLLPERRVVLTPFESGLRLGSIMEFAGFDTSIRAPRLKLLTAAGRDFLKAPLPSDPIVEPWYGFRPMTYDSLPIIDRAPLAENVFVAAGHNMLGLSMAPATGQLIAEMVCGKPCSLDTSPYSAQRFAR